jgi:GDP-L-fucose synthase
VESEFRDEWWRGLRRGWVKLALSIFMQKGSRMKRVLVTGGHGFLGKYVMGQLDELGYEAQTFRSSEFDLNRESDCYNAIASFEPDSVIHLAASVGGIGANMANPATFFRKNLMMGLNLIEACRIFRIKKFVQIGTVCSYPKFCDAPFNEGDLWEGYPEETNAPYGIAKKTLLVMLQAYKKQYDFNSAYLIPTNMYGPGDNFDPKSSHVIPALIRKIDEAKKTNSDLVIWGSGNATREFLYAADSAKAIVKAMEKIDSPSPINLGSGEEISINSLVSILCELMNFAGEIKYDDSKPDGQPRRLVDSSMAEKLLSWKAAVGLREGLQATIKYYEEKI